MRVPFPLPVTLLICRVHSLIITVQGMKNKVAKKWAGI